jgi:hypothetical protein
MKENVFIYLVVLGFELRASHLLVRHFTTGATPPALYLCFRLNLRAQALVLNVYVTCLSLYIQSQEDYVGSCWECLQWLGFV